MNTSTPLGLTDGPTNAYLDSLHASLHLGAPGTLAMLAPPGQDSAPPLDGSILIQVASAAAILACHADHAAEPQVQAVLDAIASERGCQALGAVLHGAPLPSLGPGLELEARIEALAQLVELGALYAYLPSGEAKGLATHLERLDTYVLGHLTEYEELGETAELLRGVAAFPDEHPVVGLLMTLQDAERAPLFGPTSIEALAIVHRAFPAVATAERIYVAWWRAFRALAQKAGRSVAELATVPAPRPAMAYASSGDGAVPKRFTLVGDEESEVNLIFTAGGVQLEWQGASEAPVKAEVEAQTELAPSPPELADEGDTRLLWRLTAMPGESGTRVVLTFPSGRRQVVDFPALDGVDGSVGREVDEDE